MSHTIHPPILLPQPHPPLPHDSLRDLVRCSLEHGFAPLCRALGLERLLDEETLAAARDRRRRRREQRRRQRDRGGGPPQQQQQQQPQPPPLAPVRIQPERPVGPIVAGEGEPKEGDEGEEGLVGRTGAGAAVATALRVGALVAASAAGLVVCASLAAQVPVRLGRWLLGRWLGACVCVGAWV